MTWQIIGELLTRPHFPRPETCLSLIGGTAFMYSLGKGASPQVLFLHLLRVCVSLYPVCLPSLAVVPFFQYLSSSCVGTCWRGRYVPSGQAGTPSRSWNIQGSLVQRTGCTPLRGKAELESAAIVFSCALPEISSSSVTVSTLSQSRGSVLKLRTGSVDRFDGMYEPTEHQR